MNFTFITDLSELLKEELSLKETLSKLDWTLKPSRCGEGFEVWTGRADLWSLICHVNSPSDAWLELDKFL